MSTKTKQNNYRWVLLRHIGAPDDIRGIHYDLLLEDNKFCRTWRLSNIPLLDGPYVDSIFIAPHNLNWLDIKEKVVSGNRGMATRIKEGTFLRSLPVIQNGFINLSIQWEDIDVDLVIDQKGCRILSKKK